MHAKQISTKQSTCNLNFMQIPSTVFLWHGKQMFPSFLDHPVQVWSGGQMTTRDPRPWPVLDGGGHSSRGTQRVQTVCRPLVKENTLATRYRAVIKGVMTQAQVARDLTEVGVATTRRWRTRDRQGETLENRTSRGRKSAINRLAKIIVLSWPSKGTTPREH